MEMQLGLIDLETGATLIEPQENEVEDDCTFMQMTEISKHYGAEQGRLVKAGKMTHSELDRTIIGYVDGMSAVRELSPAEREWLRNNALTAAQAWEPVQPRW